MMHIKTFILPDQLAKGKMCYLKSILLPESLITSGFGLSVAKDAHKACGAQENERAERNEGTQRLVPEKVRLRSRRVGKDCEERGDDHQDRQAGKNLVMRLFLHGAIVPLI